jgi:hypothetical protein
VKNRPQYGSRADVGFHRDRLPTCVGALSATAALIERELAAEPPHR